MHTSGLIAFLPKIFNFHGIVFVVVGYNFNFILVDNNYYFLHVFFYNILHLYLRPQFHVPPLLSAPPTYFLSPRFTSSFLFRKEQATQGNQLNLA